MPEFDIQGTVTIDAAGNGVLRFEGPPQGDWFIRRAVFVGPAANNEVVTVYVGSVDNAGVRDQGKAVTIPAVVGDESSPIRVPVSTPMFAGISGGTSGDVWTVTYQILTEAQTEALENWGGYGAPDSLLDEPGFPNQKRIPSGRR